MKSDIAKIVSGGQTGADRGGLDAAIECGVPHGGWCPKGRKAEDGPIPDRYQLTETASGNYLVRTEQNVIDSHATVIFTDGPATGGSKKTIVFAKKHSRPWLHVDVSQNDDEAVARGVLNWIKGGGVLIPEMAVPPNPVLNVAGSRESKSPGLQKRVCSIMKLVLDPPFYPGASE